VIARDKGAEGGFVNSLGRLLRHDNDWDRCDYCHIAVSSASSDNTSTSGEEGSNAGQKQDNFHNWFLFLSKNVTCWAGTLLWGITLKQAIKAPRGLHSEARQGK
jgi:hypothetical protein